MAKDTTVAAKKRTTKSSETAPSIAHPPYFDMISDALSTLKDRTGSSQPAIAKFIEAKYKEHLPPNFQKILSVQLKKFVKSERLVKVKNSFKISSTEKLKFAIKEARNKETTTKSTPTPKEKVAKKISDKGLKTKRLSQVKTPEALKKANKGSDKKNKRPVVDGKIKRLSQVKTPEGLKKKKNSTPAKRKSAKPADSSSRPIKKVRK
ncbi:hypothetical protein FEM48_Zijuj09G0016800 [Ziziphus jujuba var. spinosa]|uniref:H15 domain-containing protein n=1 Tax=Ziziphus jujuba var. spinosa TaxID=714518 RepID=A0A978UQ62_ZIZJJ|nr:hypothetical protein FEM48_Zijuj09G0016800 [Ziziphus jujuba var. spinosa]